jgi:hypothetical protein
MTTTTHPTSVEYIGVESGLTFKITVYQDDVGEFYAQIDVLEGSADFNALYFGDDVLDGSSFSFGKSLGMNGAGQVDQYGNLVDWDSGILLSDPGLGKLGMAKETYLTSGESLTVTLPGVDSWDDVAEIGVRATSTSTPSGSIKTVLEPVPVEEPEEPEDPEGPSVVDTQPEPVEIVEVPSDVTEPVAGDTPDVVDEEPADEAPADDTVAEVPAEQEIVSDVPSDDPVSDVPEEEPVGDTPTTDAPDEPSTTPDADGDAEYYEDIAETFGTVEDYPPYDEDPEEDLPPDVIL